jgi:hypothetical protein
MQRGNFRKPNNNYQRTPRGGTAAGRNLRRDGDPWNKGSRPGKTPGGATSKDSPEIIDSLVPPDPNPEGPPGEIPEPPPIEHR